MQEINQNKIKYIQEIQFCCRFLIIILLLNIFATTQVVSAYTFKVVEESNLDSGVVYKKILMGSNWRKHHVHVIEADINLREVGIKVLKAEDYIAGLDKLHNMIKHHDSLSKDEVLVAINANFWAAYNNHPISPTVRNGEVIKYTNYKKWSSCFFAQDNRLFIDYIELHGVIDQKSGRQSKINDVNNRRDSSGIVLYNRYAGSEIPFISEKKLDVLLQEAILDTTFSDVTDMAFDTTEFLQTIKLQERASALESYLHKIQLDYLAQPLINKEISCVVTRSDTGVFKMPDWGCIISFGMDTPYDHIPQIGDTISLKFSTSVHDTVLFRNAVSGTPKLVTKGKAKHKAYVEGSKGRRFIRYHLPRTAIGTNKEKTKIIFAVIESSSRKHKRQGANLDELANIMKKLGCYEAMNLDGGGSSQMIIDGKNLLSSYNPSAGRKISTGLAIIKVKPLKSIFKGKIETKFNIESTLP
jgi:exopolysaccharide biosynthesis protein